MVGRLALQYREASRVQLRQGKVRQAVGVMASAGVISDSRLQAASLVDRRLARAWECLTADGCVALEGGLVMGRPARAWEDLASAVAVDTLINKCWRDSCWWLIDVTLHVGNHRGSQRC